MEAARIARIAVLCALVAALGLTPALTVPGIAVPVTAQTLGVMLAGLMLVPIEAFSALLLFIGLVAAGLPLLSGGRGGLAVFSSPSAGFVIGFPAAALAVSLIALVLRHAMGNRRHPALTVGGGFLACIVGGVGVLYAIGVPVGAAITDSSVSGFLRASWVFLPGDLVKAAVASVVAAAAFRAAPMLDPAATRAGRAGVAYR